MEKWQEDGRSLKIPAGTAKESVKLGKSVPLFSRLNSLTVS